MEKYLLIASNVIYATGLLLLMIIDDIVMITGVSLVGMFVLGEGFPMFMYVRSWRSKLWDYNGSDSVDEERCKDWLQWLISQIFGQFCTAFLYNLYF